MRPLIIIQTAPDHWAPSGKVHHPKRCALCLITRLGMRLGLIEPEDD